MVGQPDESADTGKTGLRAGLGEILRGLADWELRTIITTTMAPAIYAVCVGGVLAINLFLALQAFQQSLASGLVWLLLVMPVTTIAGVVIVRVVLESLLSLFRIVVYMESLMEQLHTLRGQTESIADRVEDLPLPRIQFWRSRRRSAEPDAADGGKSGGKG
ncbi:MAG TPA: DUF4282 domain-containing protein [Solimonas sp.]|nr:DUF4282 domain-containing protein [Solimonas sp.]